MAERLKDKILDKEKLVDVVCGPDAYRDLPRLLSISQNGQKGGNVNCLCVELNNLCLTTNILVN